MPKPLLCLDFDGVLHSYTSGWKRADIVADPPVEGFDAFLDEAINHFRIAIFSARSNQPGGLAAMQAWLREHLNDDDLFDRLEWPTEKPPATVALDDRVLTFEGTWPDIPDLLAFRPWNKR